MNIYPKKIYVLRLKNVDEERRDLYLSSYFKIKEKYINSGYKILNSDICELADIYVKENFREVSQEIIKLIATSEEHEKVLRRIEEQQPEFIRWIE